ncbi:MAG: hypothetical protein R3F14_05955 [Polyangiaceae bacterium]
MTLQEFIDFDHYVRCICVGKDRILQIEYNPKLIIGPTGLRGRYIFRDEEEWLPKELPAHARRRRHDQQGPPVRHELGGVRHQRRGAVRDQLHEPRARHASSTSASATSTSRSTGWSSSR